MSHTEQLYLIIRWVDSIYIVHEEPIGLFKVPDTKAETLFTMIKDLLVRYSLPVNMGVATWFLTINPAVLPVHCCTHSLNLCLQVVGRNIILIRNALELGMKLESELKGSV